MGEDTKTRTITSLDEVIELAREGTIYVRYSRGHEDDIARGYSLNHQAGTREPGLSMQDIRPDDTTEFRGWIAQLVADYGGRVRGDAESYGWICRGREAGKDADGCPAVTDVEFVARLDRDLVIRCLDFAQAYHTRRMDVRSHEPFPRTEDFGL